MQGYNPLCMYICRPYMYILSLENIYIGQIYMLAMFFCLFVYLLSAAYRQIGANECKCMLHCTSMLLQMRRVGLNSVQHS